MMMIEKVARALAKAYARDTGDDEVVANRYADSFWRKFKDDARTSIEAMREPSPEMEAAGLRAYYRTPGDCMAAQWQAMIDAALSEGGELYT